MLNLTHTELYYSNNVYRINTPVIYIGHIKICIEFGDILNEIFTQSRQF